MGYRTLGRTGLEISEVGLGAGSISPSGGNLIRAALSQGINFIETSSNYKNAQVETAIGQAVKSMGSGIRSSSLPRPAISKSDGCLTPPHRKLKRP